MIYKITNTINNKTYIGLTRGSFNRRYPGGKWWKYTRNTFLKEDYRIFGPNAFQVVILYDGIDNLVFLESKYAKEYNSYYPNGYNLVKCVSGVQDDIVRSKMSELASLRWKKPEEREKQSLRMAGKKLSKEHAQKISDSLKGRKHEKEIIEKMKNSQSNRSKSHRLKIAKSKEKAVCCSNGVTYSSAKEASEILNIQRSHISNVCNNKRKMAGGLKFWFAESTSQQIPE